MEKSIGPVNSIVLSRSGEADNVYLQDETSIQENGLCEIKIIDNQIMNDNNRSDYLPDLLATLGGLEYYLNDFSSTGICYYDICDRYNIQIGENTYSCIMLNDEINVTDGLEELIYTERLEESETDYSKADKTDRKINQTYLLVDKQNQVIQSVITNVNSQNNKISQITQTVDELNSKIQDIADITTAGETSYASLELSGINESEPIEIRVRPINDNISYLYPRENLYPDDLLFMPDRKIRFTNIRTNEILEYELPDDLLYYDSENYDEFYLNYDSETCQVIKRCKYNADGTVALLDNEEVNNYAYPTLLLENGDYEISIVGYEYGYLSVRLMASNIYTSQFATKVEVKSEINQTAQNINLSVNQKLSNYSTTTEMNSAITLKANEINSTVSTKVGKNEIISRINQTAESIKINANKIGLTANNVLDILAGNTINMKSKNIALTSDNWSVTPNGDLTARNASITGNITATSGRIANYTISGALLVGNNVGLSGTSGQGWAFWAGSSNSNEAPFRVSHEGVLYATNANITGSVTATSGSFTGNVTATSGTFNGNVSIRGSNAVTTYNSNGYVSNKVNGTGLHLYGDTGQYVGRVTAGYNALDGTLYNTIALHNETGGRCYVYPLGIFVVGTVHTTSKASEKKNIELYSKNAINEILNSDIYKYNFKTEENNAQKHIGIVIGENYKASKEVSNESGVDLYSMIALAWKAIQEQQQIIEKLQKEINKLKGEK